MAHIEPRRCQMTRFTIVATTVGYFYTPSALSMRRLEKG